MLSAKEKAYIIKKDGSEIGPYKAKFAGTTVIINDPKADIEDGDKVFRLLPNGNREIKLVESCNFYNTKIGSFGPHFQLKVKPISTEKSQSNPTQNIAISGGNVQIGNNNRMEFQSHINSIIEMIDKAGNDESKKEEAKGLLKKFLEHPLVSSIAGASVGAFL